MRELSERIIHNQLLAEGIYHMRVESPTCAEEAKPGQFVHLSCSGTTTPLLRRPISICDINRPMEYMDLVYQVKGEGTALLARMEAGEKINMLAPLGHGFDLPKAGERVAIIGGGLGVYPMLFLARESKGINTSCLGFRNKELAVLVADFARFSRVEVATEDGSLGQRGYVTQLLEEGIQNGGFDVIYACGPLPMLKAVHEIALQYGIRCQVSMEERMACGIGACLGCACETAEGEMQHVCSCGPVFNSRELSWK